MKKHEAINKALLAGASLNDIAESAAKQARNVGTVPFNNMIKALSMLTWHNSQSDWIRLAGALQARANKRKGLT